MKGFTAIQVVVEFFALDIEVVGDEIGVFLDVSVFDDVSLVVLVVVVKTGRGVDIHVQINLVFLRSQRISLSFFFIHDSNFFQFGLSFFIHNDLHLLEILENVRHMGNSVLNFPSQVTNRRRIVDLLLFSQRKL